MSTRQPGSWPAVVAKPLLLLLAAAALLGAVGGGLLRAGFDLAGQPDLRLLGQAALGHAALMMSAFLGTVISIERAVALRLRWAFAAPLLSGASALALLAGAALPAAALMLAAALVFGAVNVVLVQRQRAAHTALLLAGALAWLVGNGLFAAGLASPAVLPWWFAFLVLTIAAERLEMTRLMRRHPAAQPALFAVLAALLAGAALSALAPPAGGLVYGTALVALAAWLIRFDIARRTVHAAGLSRYMALCLLLGYGWLAVAGLAWIGLALGAPLRDAALHALGLGFVFSMVMGHAPVILPAVARVKLQFGPWFYGPLALLHLSLLLRLGPGFASPTWRAHGTALNAAALLYFALTVAGAALAWRRTHPPEPAARSARWPS